VKTEKQTTKIEINFNNNPETGIATASICCKGSIFKFLQHSMLMVEGFILRVVFCRRTPKFGQINCHISLPILWVLSFYV